MQDYSPNEGLGIFTAANNTCLTFDEAGDNTDLCRSPEAQECEGDKCPGEIKLGRLQEACDDVITC